MNIIKVKIKNYQAIKNAELEFNKGITVIVGNSNNGKSSIIRSIESAINNKGGSSFINYDADSCAVEINDNNHTILWSKSKKQGKSSYNIDGKELKKIGQSQISEVGEVLNMQEVIINNEKIRLNFWKQLDFPFLVGKTPYQLFDFISKSREQELITSYQNTTTTSYKDKTKEINATHTKIDTRTTDIVNAEKELKELEKFNSIDVAKIELMLKFQEKINTLVDKHNTNTATYNSLLVSKILADNKIKVLDEAVKNLSELIDENNRLVTLLERYNKIKQVQTQLKETVKNSKATIYEDSLEKLKPIVELHSELTLSYNQLFTLTSKTKATQANLEALNKKLNNINIVITDTTEELNKFTVCPTCGHELGGNHEH